jgi:hypothetical protein
MNERYSHFQFSKDVLCETDKKLTQPHYSEKGGHKARGEAKRNREALQKSEVWLAQRNLYNLKKQERASQAKETIIYECKPR